MALEAEHAEPRPPRLRAVESDEAPADAPGAPSEAPARPTLRGARLYAVAHAVIPPLARLIYRPRVIGRKNVPKTGPVIIASNHLSFVDSIAIPMVAPRRVRFLAKSSYFDGTGFAGWWQRLFFESVGAIPVVRGAGTAAQAALDQSREIIEAGNAFAIYPEGTRSLDGRLYKGRTGAAWLALSTGAKVVPVGLKGTSEFLPVGAKVPRFKRITVEFGEPIDLSHLGSASSGRARRLATDEIMTAIQRLSGQEEAGVYNETPAQGAVARVRQMLPHERR